MINYLIVGIGGFIEEWLIALMNVVFSVIAGFVALKLGEVIAKSI